MHFHHYITHQCHGIFEVCSHFVIFILFILFETKRNIGSLFPIFDWELSLGWGCLNFILLIVGEKTVAWPASFVYFLPFKGHEMGDVYFYNAWTEWEPEELRDLSAKTLGILYIVSEQMLSNGKATHHHKISRPSSKAINGSILIHPFEEWEKKSTTQKTRRVNW